MRNNNTKLCIILICTFILGLQNNNSNATENKIFSMQNNNNLIVETNIDNTNEVNNKIEDYAKFIYNAPNNNNPVMESSTRVHEKTSITINNKNEVIIFRPKATRVYCIKNKITQYNTIKIQQNFWSNQYNNSNKKEYFIQEINKNDDNLGYQQFIQGIMIEQEKEDEYLAKQELIPLILNTDNNKHKISTIKRPKAPEYIEIENQTTKEDESKL